jgi:DNA-binding MarR family transcriptional regulator
LPDNPASLTRLVDRLADQGLVVREPHPTDRRANCVFITENGLLAMEAFSPLSQEITEELFEGVSETDLIAFNTVVETIKANVKSYMSDHRYGVAAHDAESKVG